MRYAFAALLSSRIQMVGKCKISDETCICCITCTQTAFISDVVLPCTFLVKTCSIFTVDVENDGIQLKEDCIRWIMVISCHACLFAMWSEDRAWSSKLYTKIGDPQLDDLVHDPHQQRVGWRVSITSTRSTCLSASGMFGDVVLMFCTFYELTLWPPHHVDSLWWI